MESPARLIHEIDQLQAILRDVAPLLASFADALTDAGFSRSEAVQISGSVLTTMLRTANEARNGGGS